ncbi:RmlC-like cupin domain-containing protein [Colletotrichum godetiae]|uniref:RmlC-like cupin domain-containing protein n=1 Tax=Colletotrichum godetiae TaxID=1209918 RepID=A0AAJ0B0S1_9PEZI|nr:RmlC-like cupin domain-containing protein [Colletotrichum godetiae]KAK1700504.1 RmlC-like cupin domain-containing protein [Colletotrichum godetiae]
MGSIPPPDISHLSPSALPTPHDSPSTAKIVSALSLHRHYEGGFYRETDRAPTSIPSPFPATPASSDEAAPSDNDSDCPPQTTEPQRRALSSAIFYYLTPSSPIGHFHRNRSRITHSLHRGRGRYVVLHPDGGVENFVVGGNVAAGERSQWTVEGGDYKASFVLPDEDGDGDASSTSKGLLITEFAVPGWEPCDQNFLTREKLGELVGEGKARGLEWLIKKE